MEILYIYFTSRINVNTMTDGLKKPCQIELKPHFWRFCQKDINETFLMIFEVGQGVSGINPQGFHTSVWERG